MFLGILVFVIGLCVGSFLNAVAYRASHDRQFLTGHSFCPKCRHKLKALDLIPILSFLMLGGRCRYCKAKISIQYPIVELATGFLFLLAFLTIGYQLSTISYLPFAISQLAIMWFVVSVLIVVFVADLLYGIIPDRVILPAILILFLIKVPPPLISAFFRWLELTRSDLGRDLLASSYWPAFLQTSVYPVFLMLAGGLVVSLFFLFLIIVTRGRGMGGGDVKLAFFLGLAMGWPNLVVGFFLSFLLGAIFAIILIILKLKRWGQTVPLGPFLVIGTFIAIFWGDRFLNWYLKLLGV